MSDVKILAFSGSSRSGSYNDRLLKIASEHCKNVGASFSHIQLADYELPIFGEDLEARSTPENASKLKELFMSHNALLIACPEYNSSITPLLKNVIDWVSRPNGGTPLQAFAGKTACILSASPGALGGLRGLRHVREILSNINVLVVPGQFALTSAASAFNDSGALNDDANSHRLQKCMEAFVNTAKNQTAI